MVEILGKILNAPDVEYGLFEYFNPLIIGIDIYMMNNITPIDI